MGTARRGERWKRAARLQRGGSAYLCLGAEGGPGISGPGGTGEPGDPRRARGGWGGLRESAAEVVPGLRRRSGERAGGRAAGGGRRCGWAGWGSAEQTAASPPSSQPGGFSGAKSTFSCSFRHSAPHETYDAARLPPARTHKRKKEIKFLKTKTKWRGRRAQRLCPAFGVLSVQRSGDGKPRRCQQQE